MRGGAIVDKALLVKQLYVDVKSSMLTLTGQQSGTDDWVFGTGAPDATVLYYTSGDDLYHYDHFTRNTVLVGNCGGVIMYDIAINPGGLLFGVGENEKLYSISTVDGSLTEVGDIGGINSLTFDANGVLYALVGQSLVSISTSDASSVVIGDVGFSSMGDIVFFNDVMYLATVNGTLVKYPLSERVVVGTLPYQMYGLAAIKMNDRSVLIGTTADFKICEINPDTAACTVVVQSNANTPREYFIGGATAQFWGRPQRKLAILNPPIRVPDNTVCSVVLHLLGRDMVTNDVYTSSRTIRVKNLEEFQILASVPFSTLGEGSLPVNDVQIEFLADQSSFVVEILTKSANTVRWTATVVKTTC